MVLEVLVMGGIVFAISVIVGLLVIPIIVDFAFTTMDWTRDHVSQKAIDTRDNMLKFIQVIVLIVPTLVIVWIVRRASQNNPDQTQYSGGF